MTHRTRSISLTISALAIAAIAGCSGAPAHHVAYGAVSADQSRHADAPVLVLGAGDSLGRTIRTNDIILAAKFESERPTGAVVSVDDDDN